MGRLLAVAVLVLALPGGGAARTSGGTPVALVATADGARLVMVEVWTGKVHADVALPEPGRAVASTFDARRVVVATAHGVTLADMRRGRVLARFALRNPVDLAISRDGRRAFVVERGRATLTVLDLGRRRVAGRVAVGERPHALAVSEGRVWVAHDAGDGTLAVVDARAGDRPAVVGRLRAGGAVRALRHLPDSAWLVVTYRDSGDVAKLDAGIDARVVFRRRAGERLSAVGVHWLTTDLWVADGTRLVLLSSRTGARRGAADAGAPVRELESFGGYMAAFTRRDVRVFGAGGRRFAVTPLAHGVAAAALAVVP